MTTNKRECIEQVDSKHCLSYTRLQCKECQKNFVLSNDFYSSYFSEENLSFKDNLYNYLNLPQNFNNLVGKKFCQLAEVSHCVDYINTKECRQCEQGYILTVVNRN